MNTNIAPLNKTFFTVSLIGLIGVLIYWSKMSQTNTGLTWAVTLGIFFAIMFIASMISMTYAPVEEELRMDKEYLTPRKIKKKSKGKKKK